MQRKIILLILAIIAMLSCTSCASLKWNSTCDINLASIIPGEKVTVIASGCKTTEVYSNKTLPASIKIKRNNLPIRLNFISDSVLYEPITIKAKENIIAPTFYGLMGACAVGGIGGIACLIPTGDDGINGGALAGTFILAGASAAAYTGMIKSAAPLPDKNFFILHPRDSVDTVSMPQSLTGKLLTDTYHLMESGEYELAENVINHLLILSQSPKLYFLKGLCQFELGNTKKAIKTFDKALENINPQQNPTLYGEILKNKAAAQNKRREDKSNNARAWAMFGVGALNAASQTFSAIQKSNAKLKEKREFESMLDPSKMNPEQLQKMVDPAAFLQKKVTQDFQSEYNDYLLFKQHCKKPDGSDYTFEEYRYMLLMETYGNPDNSTELSDESDTEEVDEDSDNEYSSSNRSTESSNYSSSSLDSTNEQKNSSTISKKVTKKTNNNRKSKQQFKDGKVDDADYKYDRTVTLYYRDGTNVRKYQQAKVYYKGASEYVKVGNTYYIRRYSSWQRFSNQIVLSSGKAYYY